MSDKKLQRIKKLLTLAQDGATTDAERQSALLKAQELMLTAGIDEDDLDQVSMTKPKNVVDKSAESVYSLKFGCTWFKTGLANIIKDNFRCEIYSMNRRWVHFIGLESDVDIAVEVYKSAFWTLKHQAEYTAERHRKTYGTATGIETSYMKGFLAGLAIRFKEQVEKNNWGLMLVKDNAVTEHLNGQTWFNSGKAHSPKQQQCTKNMEAFAKGYTDGKSHSHTNKPIGIEA